MQCTVLYDGCRYFVFHHNVRRFIFRLVSARCNGAEIITLSKNDVHVKLCFLTPLKRFATEIAYTVVGDDLGLTDK
jgi:hypothetical protein